MRIEPNFDPKDVRVLIVDDDPVGLEVACTALRYLQPDWDVMGFDDPHLALEMAWGLRHCVVVSDWMMPGMDGLELSRRLRSREEESGHAYHVLLLTARARIEDMERALIWANDFLVKPYDPRELRARILAGMRQIARQGKLIATNETLAAQAETDALTGLRNRRGAVDLAAKEFERYRRRKHPLSVVLLDVDHFKTINDTHGHPAGDAVLVELAKRLAEAVRPYDTVARWGGEEFVVICPHCNLTDALRMAERLRRAVGSQPMQAGSQILEVTASFGVATATAPDMDDLEPVVRCADKALYHAKRHGRNVVVGLADERRGLPIFGPTDLGSEVSMPDQPPPSSVIV